MQSTGTRGKVYYLADLLSRQELEQGRFYHEVLKPHRQLDYLGLIPFQTAGRASSLSVNTDLDKGMFKPRSVELMRLLAPHISKAATVSNAFDLRTLQTHLLASSFDALACGVVLVNSKRRVLFANTAAKNLMKMGDWKNGADNFMALQQDVSSAELDHALAHLHDPSVASGMIVTKGERPLVLNVMPLLDGQRKSLLGDSEVAAAIFVQDQGAAPAPPGAVLTQLFGLTPKETKVALAMARGLPAAEIADVLGLGVATIRTHIKSILQKAGVTRQSDFLLMMARAASPLRGEPSQ